MERTRVAVRPERPAAGNRVTGTPPASPLRAAIRLVVGTALAAVAPTAAPAAQEPTPYSPVTDERLREPEPDNWLMYRRTYDSWGYSPLEQITPDNVNVLAPLWSVETGVASAHQSPPIVNDGVMFVTTPEAQVLALNARTGDVLWRYRRTYPDDMFPVDSKDGRPHPTNRGVGLYGDKVFFTTHEAVVVALDAVSGEVVWERPVADYRAGYYMTMAPLVASGKVMVGVSGGEWGIRGFVAALDPDTGQELWRAYTIPEPSQPGSATWPGETWRTGGGAVWITGSYDPELNLTYWGTGNPGPWIGDQRQGANLYTNSVVAFDADTGTLEAYHQYHHHGSWDWDEVSAPMLIDVPRGDRTIPSLIHPGRNGYLWMLERSAGSIRFVDAWPYVHQNVFTSIDPSTGRPEYDPDRTPTMQRPATFCPSTSGGKNWPPAAYSPKTGYVYIPANENFCSRVIAKEEEYRSGEMFVGVERWPRILVREGAGHFGELQAWDITARRRAWTHEFETSANWGPVLVTGGGLVFAGGTNDRRFRAYAAETGAVLWEHRMESGVVGVPSSYAIDGIQYIAVQSGWGGDAEYLQWALDEHFGTTTSVPQGGVIQIFSLGPESR